MLQLFFTILSLASINLQLFANEIHLSAKAFLYEYEDIKTPTLAIIFKNDPGWHTYWKNPGDAGSAIQLAFKNNITQQPINTKELPWPMPEHFIEGGIVNTYGYSNQYAFFYELDQNTPQKLEEIKISIQYLICNKICIPGQLDITPTAQVDSNVKNELKQHWDNIPQINSDLPKNLSLSLILQNQKLHISFVNTNSNNLLLPFPNPLFSFKAKEKSKESSTNFILPLDWMGEYNTPSLPMPLQIGELATPLKANFIYWDEDLKKSFIFKHTFTHLTQENTITTVPFSLLMTLIFAFIGGIILNGMPCVLPVLTLKIVSLAQHPNNKLHHLLYSVGILITFAILAFIVILMKNLGHQIGWGMQMQSPYFIYAISLVLFFLSLNMWGVFEFRTPGGKLIGNTASGPILSGVLATILSTPCSAPFLGAALSVAIGQDSWVIMLTFLFMGLGLSLPFLLIILIPSSLKWIPKPGEWMNDLKKIMGLFLFMTVFWLWSIYFALINHKYIFIFLSIHLLILGIMLYQKGYKFLRLASIIILLSIPVVLINKSLDKSQPILKQWSTEILEKAKQEKKWVFMDFTAQWCITCKVNEAMVINTSEFQQALSQNNISFVVGDWTTKDERITAFLNSNNVYAVPAYFLQDPQGKLIFLGETISTEKLMQYIIPK